MGWKETHLQENSIHWRVPPTNDKVSLSLKTFHLILDPNTFVKLEEVNLFFVAINFRQTKLSVMNQIHSEHNHSIFKQ